MAALTGKTRALEEEFWVCPRDLFGVESFVEIKI
jgi:hypothetical protein